MVQMESADNGGALAREHRQNAVERRSGGRSRLPSRETSPVDFRFYAETPLGTLPRRTRDGLYVRTVTTCTALACASTSSAVVRFTARDLLRKLFRENGNKGGGGAQTLLQRRANTARRRAMCATKLDELSRSSIGDVCTAVTLRRDVMGAVQAFCLDRRARCTL